MTRDPENVRAIFNTQASSFEISATRYVFEDTCLLSTCSKPSDPFQTPLSLTRVKALSCSEKTHLDSIGPNVSSHS